MNDTVNIVNVVLKHFPGVQGIYLFGAYGTAYEQSSSDIDLALLLPPEMATRAGNIAMSPCATALASLLDKPVDLINLREVSTVFQKEIIAADRLIHCADRYAADEFEMLVLSYYQKLNEERQWILKDFQDTQEIPAP